MARKGLYRHNTVVSGVDDAGKQVSLDSWNDDLDKRGMLGFAPTEPNIPISSGSLLVTDTWTVVDAEGAPTTDVLDNITTANTATEDVVMLVADTSQVITLTHQAGGAGQVHLLGEEDITLSENVPVLLIRSGADWYEFGGSGAVSLTPWTENVDAADFNLDMGLGNISFKNATQKIDGVNGLDIDFSVPTSGQFNFRINSLQQFVFHSTGLLLNDNPMKNFSFLESGTVNPAQSEVIRLAKTDRIAWRNNANTADIDLFLSGSNDVLELNSGMKVNYIQNGGVLPNEGFVRFDKTTTMAWRNEANDGNNIFSTSSDRIRWNAVNIPTISSSDILTNKSTDADNNTITNIGSSEIKSEMITGFGTVTGASGDFVLISDTSDSGNLKKVDVLDFLGTIAQTPWLADIDADGFDLKDISNIEFRDSTEIPAGSVRYINAGLNGIFINVPTSKLLEIHVNGNREFTFASNAFNVHGGNISGVVRLLSNTAGGKALSGLVAMNNNAPATDSVTWRNATNTADISLFLNASDNFEFESNIDLNGNNLINVGELFVEQEFITFTSGAIVDGDNVAGSLVSVDETLSTGGNIFGLGVVSSNQGSADVYGLGVGIEVNPILQQSGTFADLDTILEEANDVTTELSGGGAGNITVFSNDDDTMTFGDVAKFQELEIFIDTPASGAGVRPTFEFSTGVGTWASFDPLDGTDGFRQSGAILWDDVDIPSWAVGTGSEFLIRVTRTQNTINTDPILDLVQRSAVILYGWDSVGDVIINKLTFDPTTITDLSTVTAASGDLVMAVDATDGLMKNIDLVDLLGAAGQTPWTQDIDGATFDLTNVGIIEFDSSTNLSIQDSGTGDMQFDIATSDKFEWRVNNSTIMELTATLLNLQGVLDIQFNSGQTILTDSGGFEFNLPTSDTYDFKINSTSEMVLSATGLNLGVGTAGKDITFSNGSKIIWASDREIFNDTNGFKFKVATGDQIEFNIGGGGVQEFRLNATSLDIDAKFIEIESVASPGVTANATTGRIFMDSGNSNELSIIRNGSVISLEGGEVFTWTADHDADGNNLIMGAGDIRLDTATTIFQGALTAVPAQAGLSTTLTPIMMTGTGNHILFYVNDETIGNGQSYGGIQWGGDDTSGTPGSSDGERSSIECIAREAAGGADIVFSTAQGNMANTEAMRITMKKDVIIQTTKKIRFDGLYTGGTWIQEVGTNELELTVESTGEGILITPSEIQIRNDDLNMGTGDIINVDNIITGDVATPQWDFERTTLQANEYTIGEIRFRHNDAGAVKVNYGRITGVMGKDDGGNEEGSLNFYVTNNGVHDLLAMTINNTGTNDIVMNLPLDMSGNNLVGVGNFTFTDNTGVLTWATGETISIQDNDMVLDVTAGDTFEFDVGGVGQMTITDSTIFTINNDLAMGTGEIILTEQAGNPSTPASNTGLLYAKDVSGDTHVFWIDESDNVTDLTISGGSQTPWTSNIDADGFDLTDLSNLEFRVTTEGAPANTIHNIHIDATNDMRINTTSGNTIRLQVAGSDVLRVSGTFIDFHNNDLFNADNIQFTTGTPLANATFGIYRTVDDMVFNVLTGDGFLFNVNGTTEYEFNSTTLDLKNNLLQFETGVSIEVSSNDMFYRVTDNDTFVWFIGSSQQFRVNDDNIGFYNSRLDDVGDINSGLDAEYNWSMERSANIADDTTIGNLRFRARDGNVTAQNYAKISGVMESDVAAAEEGSLQFFVTEAGVHDVPYMSFNDASSGLIDIFKDLDINGNNIVGLGDLTFNDTSNIIFNTTTGTQIGTGSTQKLAFYGDTPIVQPTALTAVDATVIDSTYDSTEEAVLNNVRTRLNEIEAKLTALGLLA